MRSVRDAVYGRFTQFVLSDYKDLWPHMQPVWHALWPVITNHGTLRTEPKSEARRP